MFVALNTWENVKKGGRIGNIGAFVVSLLNVKLILEVVQEGKIVANDKVRNYKSTLRKIAQKVGEIPNIKELVLMYSDDEENPEKLKNLLSFFEKQLISATGIKPSFVTEVNPAIAVHTGPLGMGVGVLTNN